MKEKVKEKYNWPEFDFDEKYQYQPEIKTEKAVQHQQIRQDGTAQKSFLSI